MLNKIRFATVTLTVACLAALIWMSVITEQKRYDGLLFAAPKTQSTGGADIDDIEALNLDLFRLTYELLAQKQVSSERSQTSAVLKATNFAYPYICGYNMISGGFFTQALQERESRSAVLNELAAFELFGGANIIGNSITIDDTIYTVSGVINDQDTASGNVYVPATSLAQTPNAFIALSGGEIAPEHVWNELKKVGVTDTNYDYYDLGAIKSIITGRMLIALTAIGCAVLVFIIKKSFGMLVNSRGALSELYKYNSLTEVLRISPGESVKAGLSCVLLFAGLGTLIWLLSLAADTMLGWNVAAADIGGYALDFFKVKLETLMDYSRYSEIAFTIFIVLLALDVVLLLDSGTVE